MNGSIRGDIFTFFGISVLKSALPFIHIYTSFPLVGLPVSSGSLKVTSRSSATSHISADVIPRRELARTEIEHNNIIWWLVDV